MIETVAVQAAWVSITPTTCSNHQCKKQNSRAKPAAARQKVAVLLARGVFGWLRSPLLERESVCPYCPPQGDFGEGSPSAAGLIQHVQKVVGPCFWQNAARAGGSLRSCEHTYTCAHANVFFKSLSAAELTGL